MIIYYIMLHESILYAIILYCLVLSYLILHHITLFRRIFIKDSSTFGTFVNGNALAKEQWVMLGNFASQDFVSCMRSFRADSSSPQISAILLGHLTRENVSLRKSRRFSATLPQTSRRQMSNIQARKIP